MRIRLFIPTFRGNVERKIISNRASVVIWEKRELFILAFEGIKAKNHPRGGRCVFFALILLLSKLKDYWKVRWWERAKGTILLPYRFAQKKKATCLYWFLVSIKERITAMQRFLSEIYKSPWDYRLKAFNLGLLIVWVMQFITSPSILLNDGYQQAGYSVNSA